MEIIGKTWINLRIYCGKSLLVKHKFLKKTAWRNIRISFTQKIPESQKTLESYLQETNFNMKSDSFTIIYLFNLCLEKGIIPDNFKIVKVTTLFKFGDSIDLSNYRQVSALKCFSKILERLYKHISNTS